MQRRQKKQWLVPLAIVLAIVAVLDGWTWVGNYQATSLRIIARGIDIAYDGPDDSEVVTPARPFDKTITDLTVVREIQGQMDTLPSVSGVGSCGGGTIEYRYEFIFAVFGVTTQTYTGNNWCGAGYGEESLEWGPVVALFTSRAAESPLQLPLVKQLGVPLGK